MNLDMGDKIIAACPNMLKLKSKFLKNIILRHLRLPKDTTYVNSGVLLIDMQKYREFLPIEKLNQFLQYNCSILEYHDQDTINCLFLGKIYFLDQTYNYQINSVDWWNLDLNQTIIHYSEIKKPWKDDYQDTFRARPYYQILRELGETEKLKHLIQSHSSNSVSMLYDEFSIK
jgi:lipopolysaccharide biosynthesis glycosyltransferase